MRAVHDGLSPQRDENSLYQAGTSLDFGYFRRRGSDFARALPVRLSVCLPFCRNFSGSGVVLPEKVLQYGYVSDEDNGWLSIAFIHKRYAVFSVSSAVGYRGSVVPSPTLTLSFILATLYGALFHFLVGGDARRLAFFLAASWLGFALGQGFGLAFGVSVFDIGVLHTFTASFGALLALFAARILTGRRSAA